jgi:hypothetical protein
MLRVGVSYDGRVWLHDSWGRRIGSLTKEQFAEQFEGIDRWEAEGRSA